MDEPRPGRSPDEAEALRALEQRLDRATRAAERLLGEASTAVPPRGWQRREASGDSPPADESWLGHDDLRLLTAALAAVRDRIPPELEQRLVAALRELLLAVRALVDWCLERAERRGAASAEVQDIPIL